MNEQIQLLRRYVRMVWPYRWVSLTCAFVVSVIGWAVVLSLPNQYEVTAKIFIDTRSMLRPLLQGLAITDDSLTSSAMLMKQTLLTRPNLEQVARKTDIDLKAKSDKEFDDAVTALGKSITLTGTDKDNVYAISYVDRNPQKTKRIVDELLNTFLETALGSSRKDTAVTQKFLDDQIAEYEKRLIEAEERLKEFKQKNVGVMSNEGESYFQRLQQARLSLQQAELELREAQNRGAEIRRQIEGERPVLGFSDETIGSGNLASVYDGRIDALQSQLDQLMLQYTDKHPDIQGIKAQIAHLEEKRKEELEKAAKAATDQPALATRDANENPVFREMKLALAQSDADIAALSTRVEEFRNRVKEFEKLVDTVPEVEAELKRLDRDYGLNKEQYLELLKRRESARLSQEVDQKADDITIKVIDPPRIPLTPTGPNRLRYMSLVFAAALAFGAAAAFLLSQFNPRFYASDELKEFTRLPILGAVSMVSSRRQRTERRMELAVFGMFLLGLCVVYGGLMSLELMQIDLHSHLAKLLGTGV